MQNHELIRTQTQRLIRASITIAEFNFVRRAAIKSMKDRLFGFLE